MMIHGAMTSRERVLATLKHQITDRVPRLLYEEVIGYTPLIEKLLHKHCAPKSPRDFFQMDITRVQFAPTALPRTRYAKLFLSDSIKSLSTEPVTSKHVTNTHLASNQGAIKQFISEHVDEWGVRWQPSDFHHFTQIESPLRNITDLTQLIEYPWPDLDQPYRFENINLKIRELHNQNLAVAAYAGSVFERSWYLRGMENLMLDMLIAPKIAHYLFERTAAFQRYAAEQFARAGADIIITGDDIAGQKGLLMSLEIWRKFLKPHLAATVRAVKTANPSAFVFYHSDGCNRSA
jgi:uroporphyrinogen decarboxylase